MEQDVKGFGTIGKKMVECAFCTAVHRTFSTTLNELSRKSLVNVWVCSYVLLCIFDCFFLSFSPSISIRWHRCNAAKWIFAVLLCLAMFLLMLLFSWTLLWICTTFAQWNTTYIRRTENRVLCITFRRSSNINIRVISCLYDAQTKLAVVLCCTVQCTCMCSMCKC